jgi:hypothetical protein
VSDESYDLELAAATLLGDSHDIQTLLRVLASDLSTALGARLKVERKGGLLRRSDDIKSIRVNLAEEDFDAEVHDGAVECTVCHSSGGIRIRTERLEMGQWLQRLLGRLQEEASRSQETRLALEKLVIGGTE